MVRLARAYLTTRHATGLDAFLWEARQHPMPDQAAIDSVITASDRAQQGAGAPPSTMEVAAALVTLSAVRLGLDQTEARLLNTAQAGGLDFEQIAAILGISVENAEDRYRSLKPRLDEPTDPPRSFTQRAQR
jgi:DNA-directed RNA polymerase specialized sigma24 family protein